ncbi:MAG TPA: co-chaperone GroES family protein [Kofleriaceae bacterium]
MNTLHFQKVRDEDTIEASVPRIAPLGDQVLVRVREPKLLTQNGIHLSPVYRTFEWTEYATVLAIGNGKRGKDGVRVPITKVKVGDVVVYSHRPSHEKWQLEALFGPRAFLIGVDEIDGVMKEYPCETCEAIASNFSPKLDIEADGHVCDCPHHVEYKHNVVRFELNSASNAPG